MLLDNIKTSLEKLYDIDTGINIHDYLCEGDKAPVNDGSVNVLFDPEENVLFLNIQLHPRYLRILEDESFFNKLTRKNILHYYILTEEVSHFVYLFWKCGISDISPSDVSRQELELQGKIDRYILLMDFFMRQNDGETGPLFYHEVSLSPFPLLYFQARAAVFFPRTKQSRKTIH
jgi:hypothetical protein